MDGNQDRLLDAFLRHRCILAHWAGGMLHGVSKRYGWTFTTDMPAAGVAFLLFCAVGRKRVNGK